MPNRTPSAAAAPPRVAHGRGIPAAIPGEVPRGRLLDRLRRCAARTHVLVASAPAGSGKTVLLAQVAREAAGPVAWIRVGAEHADDGRLASQIADAVSAGGPLLLVVDDLDAAAAPAALGEASAFLADLPPGVRVALGCRADAGLLLGRRLVEGGVTRITADDLAFEEAEAEALMASAGIALTPDALAEVLRRTEGWAAGLRLAALRIGDAPDPSAAVRAFAGDDRAVAAYLREVVLAGLPPETVAFLARISLLEPFSGDLCDAVLGTSGAARTLDDLARRNVLLVALDPHGERHRFHRLLGDLLRREARRLEPGRAAGLHGRASAWHEAARDAPAAVRHAVAAGDRARAERLVWAAVPAGLTRGEIRGLQEMLAMFDVDDVAGSAALAAASAWCHVETHGELAAHDLAVAARAPAPPGGAPASLDAAVATLRAMLGREGVARMGRDAATAFDDAGDDGPWRAWSRLLQGVACQLGGEPARARELLQDAAERAGRTAPAVHAMALAQLALLLLDGDEPVRALLAARRARGIVEEWGLGSQASASLPYASLALALAVSGRAEEARENVREAARLLSETLDACAWRAVEVRAAVARAALAIGDDEVARATLSGAEAFLGRLTDAPLLRDEVERLRRRVQPVPERDAACLSSITAAEARVLCLLPTHLSIREIGDRLFLSRFTVKSHAHSLYRKLGVSGRSEAVERARQLRILPAP